jgi:hypothetical protein
MIQTSGRLGLSLLASAEDPVKLDKTFILRAARFRKREFSEKTMFSVDGCRGRGFESDQVDLV